MKRVIEWLYVIFLLLGCIAVLIGVILLPTSSDAAMALDSEGYVDNYRHNASSYFQCYYYKDGYHHTLLFDSFDSVYLPSNTNVTFDGTSYFIDFGSDSHSVTFTDYYYNNPSSWSDIESIEIRSISFISLNSNTGTLSLYKSKPGASPFHESEPYLTITVSNEQLHGIVTNYFEFAGFAEPELSVRFVPYALSGDIKEEMEVDGSLWKSYAIQMIIDNPTSKNYQYSWFICPKGERPSFDYSSSGNSLENSGCNGRNFSGRVSWVHLKNCWSWILNPDFIISLSSSSSDSSLKPFKSWSYSSSSGHDRVQDYIPYQRTYLPCNWHYIASGSQVTESAFYENMKLYAGEEYDCLVYAVPVSCDGLSSISLDMTEHFHLTDYCDNYVVDFSQAELIYSSTFTMRFTTDFDPNANAVGVISYDPDSNNDDFFNSSSGRYDPDTNELQMDYNLSKYNNSSAKNYTFSGSASRSDIGTFSGAFSNVFAFVSSFFSFLPTSFQQLYFFGFTTLIVISIIKAVK